MTAAPIPADEADRLQSLYRYELLDTPREPDFDDFTWLAARLCECPISVVTLLDADRQWFKSERGLGVRETPRDIAFCAHAIQSDELLLVPDALEDPRFEDNPLVAGEPHLRFYAGAPLLSPDGHRLGTLSVMDRVPRRLVEPQVEALGRLARQVVQLMELRLAKRRAEADAKLLDYAMGAAAMAPWEYDARNDAFLFNDRAYDLFGTTAEREGGYVIPAEVYVRELCHPDDARLVEEGRAIALSTDRPGFTGRIEHRIVRRDGAVRTVAVAFGPPKGQGDEPVRAHGAIQDITERRLLEEKLARQNAVLERLVEERTATLRAQEERTRLILDNLAEAVIACDTRGELILLNRTAREWRALGPIGLPAHDRGPRGEEPELFEFDGVTRLAADRLPLSRALAGERIEGVEVKIASRAGPTRWLLVSGGPVLDDGGRRLGAVVVAHDITARRKAEEEAATALAMLDAASDGAVIVEPETLKLTYANQAAVRQSGLSREELLGRTAFDLVPSLKEGDAGELLEKLRQGGQPPAPVVIQVEPPGREAAWLEVSGTYVRLESSPPRLIAITRDVTQRREADRRAARTQRLEAIGTLASGVAHDLNNAIAPILMAVDVLRAEYPDQDELFEMLESSASRAGQMVRQLLTFARGAEGQRTSVDPVALLEEMEKIVAGTFPKDVTLRKDFPDRLPSILGDTTQLHQVLLNLCVNARDAMPRGGTLALSGRIRTVDQALAGGVPDAAPGSYVELGVGDSGCGISPEILDRIFEPFFTTKQPEEGTGLGLSTCRGIVKGHGGFLQVDSVVGEGSRVSVYLPVQNAAAEASTVETGEADVRGEGELVLVVDDEESIRRMATVVLRRSNFEVLTATDGADALAKAADRRADLRAVVADVHMPHMDGVSFVETMKRTLPDVGIVVASGRLDARAARALEEMGVQQRLEKPFTQSQLLRALGALLTSERR